MSIQTVEFKSFTDQKPGTYVSLLSYPPSPELPRQFPFQPCQRLETGRRYQGSTPSSLPNATLS